MNSFFSKTFGFIKQYPGILYSFILIFLLPLMLYLNTYLTANSFQENIDYSLQTKALTIENILAESFSDYFDNPEVLQEKIVNISEDNSDIKGLSVVKEEKGGGFKIIASQNADEAGTIINDPSLSISLSQDQAIANLITEDNNRFWNVVKPVYAKDTGEKIGLITISLSLQNTDEIMAKTITRSYVIVLVVIILSLFLILQHTRLFSYVSLVKKLKGLDKMKDDFIRMTTHELRNPIFNIRGYIELLEKDISPDQLKSFNVIKLSAKNLHDLIEDILEVSKIQQGRLDFTPKTVSPITTLTDATESLRIKAEQKNLSLNLNVSEENRNFLIKVNPTRFKQVLTNLIDNAIKYTFKGGISITTRIEEGRGRYIIEIKDTGVGISAENQERLFERFYRVKSESTASVSGTGLGLWITRQMCEKMNGEILVESIEGVGTKFTLIFPLER